MGDNNSGSLPIFPSVIFIVAPILGITGLLCWATVQNRRRFGTRQLLRQMDVATVPSEEDTPGIYEIWVGNNLKVANGHLAGDHSVRISDTHGELGDHRSLRMLIQRPLALKTMFSDVRSSGDNAAEQSTVATLIRMPQNANSMGKVINKGEVNDSAAEVLIGTSPVRIMDAGESSEPKT